MALSLPPTDPTLDPVTGLPVGADYFTQYQIPLNSQPVNLTELNAQGRQNNWLYPDHIPPTLARLQARDLTNEGNAQDLSTDGQRNLNVNIAKSSIPNGSGGGSQTFIPYTGIDYSGTLGIDPRFQDIPTIFDHRYMVGYHLAYVPADQSALDVSLFRSLLRFNDPTNTEFQLHYVHSYYGRGGTDYGSAPYNSSMFFPYKLDLWGIRDRGATSAELDVSAGLDGSVWGVCLFVSDV